MFMAAGDKLYVADSGTTWSAASTSRPTR
jgi:hypothetical protein